MLLEGIDWRQPVKTWQAERAAGTTCNMRSGIEPLKAFAQRLNPYPPGILAHYRWPLGPNLIERVNNKLKVIKRMAYGFRDDAYFCLKIDPRRVSRNSVKNQKLGRVARPNLSTLSLTR